jgi:hypothetical protein
MIIVFDVCILSDVSCKEVLLARHALHATIHLDNLHSCPSAFIIDEDIVP